MVVKTTITKVKVLELKEKAVSKKQQRFFGMVRAAQKGEGAASPEVAKVAGEISRKDAKDFAKTKHKGLPEKKKVKEDYVIEKEDSPYERASSGALKGKTRNTEAKEKEHKTSFRRKAHRNSAAMIIRAKRKAERSGKKLSDDSAADLAHKGWASSVKHHKSSMTPEQQKRRQKLADTPYKKLSKDEQDKDKVSAKAIMSVHDKQKKKKLDEKVGGAGTLVRQGVRVGGKKGGRVVQAGTTAATTVGKDAAVSAAQGNKSKMVGSGTFEKAGAAVGGAVGGAAGFLVPDGPAMVAGEIAGGIAGAKIGGKVGRQIDKIGAKKEEKVYEGVMDIVRKYSKKKKEEKKPQKAQDAGARLRRKVQRREYAAKVSGSED